MRKPPKKPKPLNSSKFNALDRKPKSLKRPASLNKGIKSLAPEPQQSEQEIQYRSLTTHADQLFNSEHIEEALESYKQLCDLAPPKDNHPFKQVCRCYRKVAKGYKKKKDYKKVVELLEDMFEISEEKSHNFKAIDYKILGECYMKLGEFEEAQAALEDALYLKPDMHSATEMLKTLKAEEVSQRLSGLKDLPYDSFD